MRRAARYTSGKHSVDPDLGLVRVRRMVSASAGGRILNAKRARSQYSADANAVYHATGKRVRDLPITCEKVM